MSNCTGYSFSPQVDLCTQGPVGNGNVSTLQVEVTVFSSAIGTTNVDVVDWDGTEIMVDLPGLQGNVEFQDFSDNGVFEDCNIDSAQLTISPDTTDGTTGMLTLEIVISCGDLLEQGLVVATTPAPIPTSPIPTTPTPTTTPTTTTSRPTVNENCGGSGPHTLVEMMAFDLSGDFCNIR